MIHSVEKNLNLESKMHLRNLQGPLVLLSKILMLDWKTSILKSLSSLKITSNFNHKRSLKRNWKQNAKKQRQKGANMCLRYWMTCQRPMLNHLRMCYSYASSILLLSQMTWRLSFRGLEKLLAVKLLGTGSPAILCSMLLLSLKQRTKLSLHIHEWMGC